MENDAPMKHCIVVSGIDGSGKSTIIEALRKSLEARGHRTACIWLRFNHYLTKGMHAIARVAGLSVPRQNEMGHVWQHELYRSKAFCRVYVLTTYLDTWVSRLKYNRAARHADTVICDRWITDILVDLAVKTRRPDIISGKWARRFMRIAPATARYCVVHRNLDHLLDCRLENRVDPDFRFRLQIYEELMKQPYILPVDNNGTIDASVAQIAQSL